MALLVGRQQLALDTRRDLFPSGFGPSGSSGTTAARRRCPRRCARPAARAASGVGRTTSVGQTAKRATSGSQSVRDRAGNRGTRQGGFRPRRASAAGRTLKRVGARRFALYRNVREPLPYPSLRQRYVFGLRLPEKLPLAVVLAEDVAGAGDEDAGAAGLAPHAIVAGARGVRNYNRRARACARRSTARRRAGGAPRPPHGCAADSSLRARAAPAC